MIHNLMSLYQLYCQHIRNIFNNAILRSSIYKEIIYYEENYNYIINIRRFSNIFLP